jgi:hypothetical protein
MSDSTYHTGVDEALAESVVRVARTSLGDTLRSVVAFTPAEFDVLYVRSDLYDSAAAARAAKWQLVSFERVGFAEAPIRDASADAEPSSIGPYEFTVRFHEDGFVARVLEGSLGVLLTTDDMDVTAFAEAATAIKRLLADRG